MAGPTPAELARPKAKRTPTIAAEKQLDAMDKARRPSTGGASSMRGAPATARSAPGRSEAGKNFDQSFAAASGTPKAKPTPAPKQSWLDKFSDGHKLSAAKSYADYKKLMESM